MLSSLPLNTFRPSRDLPPPLPHLQDCWPSAWLAQDLPGARLLSVEYQVGPRLAGPPWVHGALLVAFPLPPHSLPCAYTKHTPPCVRAGPRERVGGRVPVPA